MLPVRLPRLPHLAVLALVVLVASACLGPDDPDPSGTAPFGRLDAVVPDGDGFRVRGWVVDPDTAAPIEVTVSTGQRPIKSPADLARPDVGAVLPAHGPNHGFDVRYPGLGPGVHQVCVWAENVGPGTRARALGCADVDLGRPPIGTLDVLAASSPGQVRLAGWAWDPDTPWPVDVVVRVDGAVVLRRTADTYRSDLDSAFGRGGRHSFAGEIAVAPGNRTVCVTALNVGSGTDLPMGCRTLAVAALEDRRPTGTVDQLSPQVGGARIVGRASDVDGAVGSVALRVDGGGVRTVAVANGSFDTTVTGLGSGPHELCVTIPDVVAAGPALNGSRDLPCATVVLGDSRVGTAGAPRWWGPVGPPSGHPLARIDRDAGVSVRMRDGSLLWFFADSSETDDSSNLRYFVNNTAAWAAAGAPTTTRDGVAAGSRPVQFVDPSADFPACPAGHPPAMWPLSAVAHASGSRDRVIVFLGNVCLGGFGQITEVGISVAEYFYDPADPPVDRAIRGTLLDQVLFTGPQEDYGTAAVMGGDGMVYAYACARPAVPSFMLPGVYGPCTVARVDPGDVDDVSEWRYWNGSSWVSSRSSAAAMSLPDGVDGYSVPVASASVAFDPVAGRYVMAYSPWPGFTDRVQVRVASQPQGPWTAPVDVHLPGCYDTVGGSEFLCYAGTVQPRFSAPGMLGLGHYDQRIDAATPRGQYRVTQVPFEVQP